MILDRPLCRMVSKVLRKKINQRSKRHHGRCKRKMPVLRPLRLARRRAGGGGRVEGAINGIALRRSHGVVFWGLAYGT